MTCATSSQRLTATNIGLDHPDGVFRPIHQAGQYLPVEVRYLRRAPDREHVGAGFVQREKPAGLDWHAAMALHLQLGLEVDRRFRQRPLRLAGPHNNALGDV